MQEFTDRQIEIMEVATKRIDKHGIQNLTTKTLAADLGLSEAALYRHFEGKNDILLSLLKFFKTKMKIVFENIPVSNNEKAGNKLREIFHSQLSSFDEKPAIVSVIFAENIFHYDEQLSSKVFEIVELTNNMVKSNIQIGQEKGDYKKSLDAETITTIIIGAMRMSVLKWKISGNKSNIIKDGMHVLDGILKMIEK